MQHFLTGTFLYACIALCVSVDDTLREGASGSAVVRAVVGRIEDANIFPNDNQFLRRIAYVESKDGTDNNTYRIGYYGGIWQMNEVRFQDTQNTSLHQGLVTILDSIQEHFDIDWPAARWQDLRRPLYSGLAARLFLSNIPVAIPFASNLQAQGEYWETHYNTNAVNRSVERFVQDIQSLLQLETCSVNSDIIFVLDSSGSVGSSNFGTVRQFVLDFVQGLTIGPNDNQVGVILFSGTANIVFNLNTYSSKGAVLSAISNIVYIGGGTSTHSALQLLITQGFTTHGGARLSNGGVSRLAIVLTDGISNSAAQTISAASAIHSFEPSINVYAIGVGSNLNQAELNAIASQPSYVSLISSFDISLLENLQQQQSYELCYRAAVQTQIGHPTEGNLDMGESARFMYTIPEIGMTIQMCVEIGNILMFASTETTTPNSAFYEYSLNVTADGTNVSVCNEVYVNSAANQSCNNSTPATDNTTCTLHVAVNGLQERNEFAINSTTGDTRTDIDECAVYGNPCGPNGTCVNLVGNYSCTCDNDFELVMNREGFFTCELRVYRLPASEIASDPGCNPENSRNTRNRISDEVRDIIRNYQDKEESSTTDFVA